MHFMASFQTQILWIETNQIPFTSVILNCLNYALPYSGTNWHCKTVTLDQLVNEVKTILIIICFILYIYIQ